MLDNLKLTHKVLILPILAGLGFVLSHFKFRSTEER